MSKAAVARSVRAVGKEERKSQLDEAVREYRHLSASELVNELQQWSIDDGEHKNDAIDDGDNDEHDSDAQLDTAPSRAFPSTGRRAAAASPLPAPCKMSLIFRDDIFSTVFSFIDGHSAALLCCVCQSFNSLLQDPIVWQHCAAHYWGDPAHSASLLGRYSGSWKQMVIDRPHARLDGIYVLETKYWKPGGERFGEKQQRIIEVTYYRYLHFHPQGRLYYALLNTPPSLFHPLPTSHPQLKPAQFLYSSHGHHIYLKVDVGHELQYMKLQMRQTRGEERWGGILGQAGSRKVAEGGAWNRLRVVEFKGKGEKERDFFYYPSPATEFLFYMTSGIQTFEDDEEKERMRLLLESNDDYRPDDA